MNTLKIVLIPLLVILFCRESLSQVKDTITEKFSSSFSEGYHLDKTYQVPDNNPLMKGFESQKLKNAKFMAFKSKKEVKKNTRLAFKVVIYNYNSSQDANNKFKELKNNLSSKGDLIFSKDWNFVVVKGNYLYKLNGGCLYSQQAWKELKKVFIEKALSTKVDIIASNSFEIQCGGL